MTTNDGKSGLESGSKSRLRVIKAGFFFLFIVIVARLAEVQVLDSAAYQDLAAKQYQARIDLPATRGSIYDRHGSIIASNSIFVSFAADPKLALPDADKISEAFAAAFAKPKSYYLAKLNDDSRFVWLERQVHVEYLKNFSLKDLPGVVVRFEPKRLYHYDHLAAQVIGFTNIDNEGTAGLELQHDSALSGRDGYVIFQRDGKGRARPVVDYPRVEPKNGNDLYLTLDLSLQAVAEEELKRGSELHNVESGIVVMMDPHTGEILALAQYPSINLNNVRKTAAKDQKLRAITDVFEPGSVFKLVTTSAAIEHRVAPLGQKFYGEQGKYLAPIGRGRFRTIKDVHPHGWMTIQQAVEQSSNIVMAKLADIIGGERFYKMARDYGFGIATNIELPGEVKGTLKKPVDWSRTTLQTMAFGYEVGATPLQLVTAYAVVANGGLLVRPHILKKEQESNGRVRRQISSETIRRVISSESANILKEFFVGVVDSGTATTAAIPGVRIAGKTGTSKKFVGGRYEAGKYTASFIGFFPADDPKIVCLVMMDNPRAGGYYGGTISAPVFHGIAQRIINTTEAFARSVNPATRSKAPEPDFTESNPVPLIRASYSRRESIERESEIPAGNFVVVPNLIGFTVRKAISLLTVEKFEPVVHGSGTVASQDPPAGAHVEPGSKIVLNCQPRTATVGQLR